MTGTRTTFTIEEAVALRLMARRLEDANTDDQKRLRDGMRGLGFYISAFEKAGSRFGVRDFDRLIEEGQVKIRG
jgi:hypothetical protein